MVNQSTCYKTVQALCPKNSVIKVVACDGIIGNSKYFILQFTNNKICFHHYISKSNTKIALSNILVEGNSSVSNDTSIFIQNTNIGGFTGDFGMSCAIFVDGLWYLSVLLELSMLEKNLFLIKCLCISKKVDSKYFPFQENSRSNEDISIDILSYFQPRTHLLNTNENNEIIPLNCIYGNYSNFKETINTNLVSKIDSTFHMSIDGPDNLFPTINKSTLLSLFMKLPLNYKKMSTIPTLPMLPHFKLKNVQLVCSSILNTECQVVLKKKCTIINPYLVFEHIM